MSSPRVTVVMPCRNAARYVAAALESVFSQTMPPCAVHVIDDGSTDDSVGEIERAFARAGDVRCTLTSRAHRGLTRTRNELCEAVETDMIAFLDADDLYAPTRLERLLADAPARGFYCAFSGVDFLLEEANEAVDPWLADYELRVAQASCLPTAGFAVLRSHLAVNGSNLMVSRDLYDAVGGFDSQIVHCAEWDFMIRTLYVVEPRFVPECLVTYRRHAGNMSSVFREGPAADELERVVDNYLEWALGPTPNLRAPTPGNWPRFFRLFACADETVAGWRLADRLPREALVAGAGDSAGETAAIRRLLGAATFAADVGDGLLDDLLVRCAEAWSRPA